MDNKKPSDTPNLDGMFASMRSGRLSFPGKAKEAVASALYYARSCIREDIEKLKKLHADEIAKLKQGPQG